MRDDTARLARVGRVTALALDPDAIRDFVDRHHGLQRDGLLAAGHLLPAAPAKGTASIAAEHRTESG